MRVEYKNEKGQKRNTADMTEQYCNLYIKKIEEKGATDIQKI